MYNGPNISGSVLPATGASYASWHLFGALGLIVLGMTIIFMVLATRNLVPAGVRRRFNRR